MLHSHNHIQLYTYTCGSKINMGLLSSNINTGVHVRARSGRVTQICHNRTDGETGLESAGDVMHRKMRGGFWGFWKSQLSWVEFLLGRKTVWLSLARRSQASGLCGGCRTGRGGGGHMKKARIERMCISPFMSENL